jgi:hypothetical protein
MGESFLAGEQGLLRAAPQDVRQAHHGQGLARAIAFASSSCCGAQAERQCQRQRPVSRRRCQTAQEAEDRQRRRIAFLQPSAFEPPVRRVFRLAALPRAPATTAATATSGRLRVLASRAHERSRRPAAQSSASALAPVWSVISARLPSQRFVLACLSTIYECICTSAPGALCLKSPFSGFFGPSPVFVARYRALPPAYHACPHAIRTSIRFGASMRREKRADRCRTDKNCDDR